MDAHLFRLFCKAAESWLLNARLEKIQEPAPDHICISFYNAGLGRRHLYFRFGRKEPFCFIGEQRLAAAPKPSAFVMRLRKYCADKRVGAVISQPFARRLWLFTGSVDDKSVYLCLDLVKGASLHFLADAELPTAEVQAWPTKGELEMALENWRAWPVLTPALRRTMQCLSVPEQWALMADLADGLGNVFLYAAADGAIRKVSAWPLPAHLCQGLAEQTCEEILPALARSGQDIVLAQICAAEEKMASAAASRRARHLRKLLAKLDDEAARLKNMLLLEQDARALSANLWRWDKDAHPEQVEIPEIDGRPGRNIVLPRPHLSLVENMEKMFHDARRGKRGLVMQAGRRAELEAELAALENGAGIAEVKIAASGASPQNHTMPGLPKGLQPFRSSDGLQLWRGRDAKGNLLALRRASGHDIWVHAENGPGAHVIIRRPHPGYKIPEKTLQEAGTLAANKSWLAEASTASVMYAEARHVKPCRSGPPGKVTIDKIMETRIVPVNRDLEQKLADLAASL